MDFIVLYLHVKSQDKGVKSGCAVKISAVKNKCCKISAVKISAVKISTVEI